MLKRIFGLLSVTILLSTLSIGSASAEEGQVTDDTQGLIAQIRSSDDPFATLDSFPQDAQDLILPELSKLSDIEANDLFKYQISASPFTAMAAAYYTDIAWSAVEKAACVIHVDLLSCNRAASDASLASSSAANIFAASTLHNGQGDAFRHCFWNALMTKSIGVNGAMKIASNHENVRNGPANEKSMDLANNLTGRNVGLSSGGQSQSHSICNTKARTGQLVTLF